MNKIIITAIILAALAAIFKIWSIDTIVAATFILGLLAAFVVEICAVVNRSKK